ncbi:TIGR03943 family protein [Desulfatibacillum alkenivorans DSM 16219]|jgi:uncharacterized repeat protein (TIGR03943 family)|uniref:TIGR03943 family protein n=1 Tax=Desulfatibacillum alkenivorans DSM 16219 TaxID=1121393 RepID=A0A1M6J6D1_9BACT|nr:TIGR03943 family protein [Desulfatibacillum alkenivorans]SHJ42219.1 TIGR03943 family protein [Desulfatibacillum alkenivorans DSM 16219]
MRSTIHILEKWFAARLLPWVLIAWVLAYGWLLEQDRYLAFLQPRFAGLMYMGLIIAGLFALAAVSAGRGERAHGSSHMQWIRAGFLLLPILFIIGAHNTGLGGFALSKRALGTSMPGKSLKQKIERDDPSLWTMDIKDLPPVEQEEKPVILSKLLRNWEDYEGGEVLTEGMYYAPEDAPEGLGMVFRFYITCCAADAVPVGVFVKGKGLESLKNDQWVRVRGVCGKEDVMGRKLPTLTLKEVQILPAPDVNEQYLYF